MDGDVTTETLHQRWSAAPQEDKQSLESFIHHCLLPALHVCKISAFTDFTMTSRADTGTDWEKLVQDELATPHPNLTHLVVSSFACNLLPHRRPLVHLLRLALRMPLGHVLTMSLGRNSLWDTDILDVERILLHARNCKHVDLSHNAFTGSAQDMFTSTLRKGVARIRERGVIIVMEGHEHLIN